MQIISHKIVQSGTQNRPKKGAADVLKKITISSILFLLISYLVKFLVIAGQRLLSLEMYFVNTAIYKITLKPFKNLYHPFNTSIDGHSARLGKSVKKNRMLAGEDDLRLNP